MGNRAARRAWASRVQSDAHLTDMDKTLAMTIADMDRRGFSLCRMGDDFFFQPKPQYAISLAAA